MVAHRPAAAGRTAALRIATRIGPEIGLSRAELGLPIETVARRANVAPSTVLRVIAGDPGVHLDTLCAVAMAVGLSVSAKAYPAAPPSLRDTGQMSMAGHLIALAHSSRRPNLEHPVGDPYGRAADLVFFGPEDILDFELERHVVDFQAQHRRAKVKAEALRARHDRPVWLVMTIEDTRRNRSMLAPHRKLIESALHASSRAILRCLRTGEPLRSDGLLWVRPWRHLPEHDPGSTAPDPPADESRS